MASSIAHETFMHRCIALARLASGHVSPNPMVGAILVFENEIIGEGYHQRYGEAHAEVNCIKSVKESRQHLISQSTMYVSLEPCAHFGKTPPCADLLIKHSLAKVIIGCLDPFKEVDGKGKLKLESANIKVVTGILENECKELNKRFFTFHHLHRPYIILKWAEAGNKKIANEDYSRVQISNELTNRLVHKWRSEEAAIMAGTNTVLFDDPYLTNRLWTGRTPIRLILDLDLRLPSSLKAFDQKVPTVVFNTKKHEDHNNLLFYHVTHDVNLVEQVVHALYQLKIQSVLVEGGAKLLQSFIDTGMWDEARVIINNNIQIPYGLPAPVLDNERFLTEVVTGSDRIGFFSNNRIKSST